MHDWMEKSTFESNPMCTLKSAIIHQRESEWKVWGGSDFLKLSTMQLFINLYSKSTANNNRVT